MALLLHMFLVVGGVKIPRYGINVFCPNMFNSFTETVLNAYVCYIIDELVTDDIKHIFEYHVNSLASSTYDETKKTKINNILGKIADNFLIEMRETVSLSSIPGNINIFNDKHFDKEANDAYIAEMRHKIGSATLVNECIYNFILFAKIPSEYKINFLVYFYDYKIKLSPLHCILTNKTTFDAWDDKLIETLFKISKDDFEKYGMVEVCFNMDLSELTGLFLNELDGLFRVWINERLNAVPSKEIESSIIQAKDKIRKLYGLKYSSKNFTIPSFSKFSMVNYITMRFKTLDYQHAMCLLKYKTSGFSKAIINFVEYTADILCDEFEQGFIEQLNTMAKQTKYERDQNESKPIYLTVLRQFTRNF